MKNIGVITNPKAGRGAANKAGLEALRVLQHSAAGVGYDVHDLSDVTADKAKQNAKDAIKEGALSALVVIGGDGTVNLGYNIVAETGIPLAIIPSGSGNDFVRAVGIPTGKVAEVSQAIMLSLANNNFREVDAGKITLTGDEGGFQNPRYFASVLTGGIDAAISELAGNWILGGSTPAYTLAILSKVSTIRPYGYKVSFTDLDGNNIVLEKPAAMCSAAVSGYYGGGVHVAPGAEPDDGCFTLVVADEMTTKMALKLMPKMYSGAHANSPAFNFYKTKSILFEESPELVGADGRKVVSLPTIRADGEQVGHFPMQVDLVPAAVKIIEM